MLSKTILSHQRVKSANRHGISMQWPGMTADATPDSSQKPKVEQQNNGTCKIPVSFFPSLIHPLLLRH